MKNTFTTILILFICVLQSQAQCDVINASFEDWTLQPVEVEAADGTMFSNDVLIPDNTASVLRALFIVFELFGGPEIGMVLESDPQGFFGIDQSTDASDGDFAVKLQAGYDIPVADIYSPMPCTVVPEVFEFDVKHIGDTDDTLDVFVIFDEGLGALPQDEADLVNYPAYATGQFTYNSDSAYHRISLPVIENFDGPVDTFYYIIIATTVDDSYFLIDNLSTEATDEPDVCSFDSYPSFSISQTNDVCICEQFSLVAEEGTFVTDFVNQDTVPPLFLVTDADDNILYISTINTTNLFDEGFCLANPDDDLFIVQVLYEDENDLGGIVESNTLGDITGCHVLSEKLLINKVSEEPVVEVSLDGDPLPDEDDIIVCLFDDIIETFSFSNNTDLIGTVFILSEDSETIVDQFSTDETTTFFGYSPGEYGIGLASSIDPLPNSIGQTVEESIALVDCWWGSDNFYNVLLLGNGDQGCTSSTIDKDVLKNVLLLQNPVSERVQLQVQQPINKAMQINISDMNGKLYTSQSYQNLQNNLDFDVANYPQGTYLLQILSEDGIASYKFIKM